jgi:uncharacterized protein YdbL (DUF1318 family)
MATKSVFRMGLCGTLSALAIVSAAGAAMSLRAQAAQAEVGYRVMEYSGRVAVFSSDGGTPVEVTDIETRLLPEYDRTLLESGITAETEEQLRQLLEDLGS